ncbi:type VI secretion system VgrG family protein [Variovorax sp. OAS795]|uniref:type VI secretion system tip protein TssI/VgrG n=1 Tax=Variovorax sp. OAS795 TaxID=3034231 RepID=UPI0033959B7E
MSTIAQRLPADRRFEFSSQACPSDTFAVVRMSGFEAISRPYRFELVLVSDDARIDLARVLAANALLKILAPNDTRQATPYAGMLAEFDQLHQVGGFTFYRAVLVPRLWQLSLYRNSEVYLHEQTIPEIVEGILKGARLNPANDYTLKLKGQYRPRSYVCQYQETPLAFVSRWLEREGIYYYFEQGGDADKLVLIDDKVAQPPAAVAVNYRPADELDVGLAPDSVQGFVCRTRPLPKTLVLQDYNHRRASMPLVAQAEVSTSGIGEEMLYGENFRTEEEGQRYASIRAEELRCGGRAFSGEATAVGLRSGHFMELTQHYRDDFNGRYLVTEITHEGSQAGALLAGLKTPFNEREGQTAYRNSFVALPAATQFRPARSTPKPRVAGTMSATVDAEGSGEYAELDEHGQYKVQIPFDRTEKGAAKGSAPVRMASPYAGSEHGMHFPLHKGTEVLLSFADGDPDQPVILGAVPNSVTPNVVDQRNPHDNLISTKGGNQMLMADTKGKEVIWLNSPFHKSSIGIGSVHPEGGGSIYEATTGGKDSVSFGHSNSMSFGTSNALSLGTKASISAAFTNDVSVGTKIGIDLSSSVAWKANLGQLGSWSDGLMNVSIDDSSSVKLSRSFGGSSSGTATISAGAVASEVSAIKLETSLKWMRGLISAYTAVNFTQSTLFGMAVNASDNGALLEDKAIDQKGAKSKQDDADLKFAADEAELKKQEKAALEKKEPPAEYKTDEEKAAWRRREEKAIDDKFKNRAAAQAAPSNPDRKTLQGWPGIITKFGFDAISNVAVMAAFQVYARKIAKLIKQLKVVSEMTLGETGIVQSVNGESAPPVPASLVRSEVRMSPTSGIELKAGSRASWRQAWAEGYIDLDAWSHIFRGRDVMSMDAPFGAMRDSGTQVGMAYSGADDKSVFGSSASKLVADAQSLQLAAPTIEIGPRTLMNPQRLAAQAGLDAAMLSLTGAGASVVAAEQALKTAKDLDADALVLDPLEATLATNRALEVVARDLVKQQSAALAKAEAKVALSPMASGITIDNQLISLTQGTVGMQISSQGISLSVNTAVADFKAISTRINSNLIKLG